MRRAVPTPSLRLCLLALLCTAAAGCRMDEQVGPEETSIDAADLHEASDRVFGTLELNGAQALVARNRFGTIVLDGENRIAALRWYLNRIAAAPTRQAALDTLDAIRIAWSTRGDTLVAEVVAPARTDQLHARTDQLQVTALMQLGIPYTMPVRIQQATGAVIVSSLQASLLVEEAQQLGLDYHHGSCDLTVAGPAALNQLLLPEAGQCRLAAQGGIGARISRRNSASILLQTDSGSVAYHRLDLNVEEQTEGRLRATLGTGAGQLRLVTTRGDIRLEGY